MKIVVIGGGPAGESAARFAAKQSAKEHSSHQGQSYSKEIGGGTSEASGAAQGAAKQKADVLLIEKENLGGLCLNRGCIPSKTLLSFAKKIYEFNRSEVLKEYFQPKMSLPSAQLWSRIQQEKQKVIDQLQSNLAGTMQREGVQTLYGYARFVSPDQLCVTANTAQKEEKTVSFDRCIIAVGSAVAYPPPLNQFQGEILDSDGVMELKEVPESLLIVGGGAVGCEFACLFQELGCKVTIVEKTANLLPGEDEQIVNQLRSSFEKRGVRILSSTTVSALSRSDSVWEVSFSSGDVQRYQSVLVCAGRKPNNSFLDLEKAGVQFAHSGIEVNEFLSTSNPHIYAVGDVNGLSLLAHAGSKQGEIAAANALGAREIYNGSLVPRCLYTWPEVASVGLWKYAAESKGMNVKTQRFFFQASGRALAEGDAQGFIQIVTDQQSQEILGAQIIGPGATEMIHIFSVALKQKMVRKDLQDIIFAHPTLAEGIKMALEK